MVSNAIQGDQAGLKAIASSLARANQATDAARMIEGRSIPNEKASISRLVAATASRADVAISNIPGGGAERGGPI